VAVSVTTRSEDNTSFRLLDAIRKLEIWRPGRKYKAASAQDIRLDGLHSAPPFPPRRSAAVDLMLTFKSTAWSCGPDRTCITPEKPLGSPLFCLSVSTEVEVFEALDLIVPRDEVFG